MAHFQALPVKFLASPLVISPHVRPQLQPNRAAGFPHLFPAKFVIIDNTTRYGLFAVHSAAGWPLQQWGSWLTLWPHLGSTVAPAEICGFGR